jgi:alkylation response protein AidB-like acyl-CoA dehydrogenase
MDLALSDEQTELVASFTNLLSKESSAERVRAAEPDGFDEPLWRTLVDIGAVTMAVPADRGGWGASLTDLVLVAEQIGRALAPAPVIDVQVAARLLAAAGSDPALAALQQVLAGELLVTLALHPPAGGDALLTPAGAVCDAVLVHVADGLLLVPVADGARRRVSNLGATPLADVRLDLDTAAEVTRAETATELTELATDEWLLLTAAAMVGAGAAAHEDVCRYATERRAFGEVIGRYQGVAHPLADDATALDGARLLVHKAAWASDTGQGRSRELASMAFAFATETAERATYDAIHFHGGYGFMLEHDVQLHYRRVRGWGRVWGDAEAAYRRAADARYGGSV